GVWSVLGSQAGSYVIQLGDPGDKLVPADYDGDGKADVAVFGDGEWQVLGSQAGSYDVQLFGGSGDIPVPADYDGDGRADVAVFRAGGWRVLGSEAGSYVAQFGDLHDTPVPAAFIPLWAGR
ncbi:MAG: FG-GAP repeat domain-containing protein, partial [Pyrinomonadaceae bacterium]